MGLMQVMPATYDELRQRHNLGDDPYDPHDNILAGTAYIREMYDRFGAPGFLAAYNAGPARLDAYLAGGAELPGETANYLASVAPRLGAGTAMSGPLAVYAGAGDTGYAAPVQVAAAPSIRTLPWQSAAPVLQAAMEPIVSPGDYGPPEPEPAAVLASAPARLDPAPAQIVPRAEPGIRLVAAAPPRPSEPGGWAIQVGAYASPGQARDAAENARYLAGVLPLGAQAAVRQTNRPDGSVLFRARVIGIPAETAQGACGRIRSYGRDCIVVSPDGSL